MTREEARDWLIANLNVSRGTFERLDRYAALVEAEQAHQNLVSASTLPHFYVRHVVDSAQLILHARNANGTWLDIGSGAGLPGIVLAILTGAPICLVEPRPLRAGFLKRVIEDLELDKAWVESTPLARVESRKVAVVTARAVAALPKLIAMANRFADLSTIWLLPKGKNAATELASLPRAWHDKWRVEPSVTDVDSRILVGRGQMKG